MFVKYQPEGEPEQVFEFDPATVRASRAEMIEKRFGGTWDEFREGVFSGSIRARRTALWHLLNLQHPTLRFEDVDYVLAELTVEYSRAELERMRAAVEASTKGTEDQRAHIMSRLDAEIATAPVGAREGKALSKPDAESTPSP